MSEQRQDPTSTHEGQKPDAAGRISEKRRALGRGLGALIPSAPHTSRPVDVFFRDAAAPTAGEDGHLGQGGQEGRAGDPDATGLPSHDAGASPTAITEPAPTAGAGPGSDEDRSERGAPADSPDVPGSPDPPDVPTTDSVPLLSPGLAPVPGAVFAELPVSSIRPNPKQPRTVFDEDDLAELAHSIREIGVLQPVVVRRVPEQGAVRETHAPDSSGAAVGADQGRGPTQDDAGAAYELIMGERRLRATQIAGLATIPAIIKDTQDDDLLRDALLENLHRSQLNPLEEAAAYQQLLDDFGCSHEELAARIGRSRPQISNTLRLLRLPPLVARRLAAGVLSAGHARALLGLEDRAAMERLAQRIVAEGLSVRSVEEIVALGGDRTMPTRRPRAGTRHPQLDDLSARLSDRLDTRVSIALGQRKGKITVEFASVDDLNRIVTLLGEHVDPPETTTS